MTPCHLTERHPSALTAVRNVVEAFRLECVANPVATMSESHLKVVAVQALLAAGCELLEGSARATVNKRLSLRNGRIASEDVPRRTPLEDAARLLAKYRAAATQDVTKTRQTSADLRVCSPCSVVFEFQARSIYGTQDTLAWKNLIDDYERLGSGRADVFVLACDEPIYNALRGNRRDARGRKAAFESAGAQQILPAADLLPIDGTSDIRPLESPRFGDLRYIGCRVPESAAVGRIVLAWWAVEPTPVANPDLEEIRRLQRD
jgi:hypothetical protein